MAQVPRLVGLLAVLGAIGLTASCASAAGDGSSPTVAPTTVHSAHTDAKIPEPAPLRAGERFVELKLPRPYTPSAPNGGTDEYRCFLVDPKLTTEGYLTGSQFLPQNADLVHHAIFFRAGPADVAAAEKIDAETPADGWTCFGDAGIGDDAAWVAHWAPGANEVLLADDLGYAMPAGSRLIMQLHYNLLGGDGPGGDTDQSAVRLRLAEPRSGMRPLETELLAAPVELPCAPGESGPLCDRAAAVTDVANRFGAGAKETLTGLGKYCGQGKEPVAGPTQQCTYQIEEPHTVYATAGHMHLLGRAIKVELNPGTAAARTLLDLPVYDFDEQAIRPLPQPVDLKPGDSLRVTCTHDAGLRKAIPQLSSLPPRYVVWGEGTSDEMCLGLVVWTGR